MAETRWYAKLVAVLTVPLAAGWLTLLSRSAAYAAPSTWSTPVNISNSGIYKHPPSIAVDFKGNIHVVWYESDASVNIVYTKWDGTSWSTPTVLNQGVVGSHSLVADSLGRVHLVYADQASGFLSYRVLNTSAGSSWSTPTPVTQIPNDNQGAALAVDSSNNPHVVWPRFNAPGNSTIYYSSWNNQAWSTPQPISNDASADQPRIAVDQTGIAHVVWWDSSSHLGYYWDSSNGSTPIQLSNTDAFEPDIATDNAGTVYVVWSSVATSPYNGIYYRFLKGSVWSPVSTLIDTGGNYGEPSLTVDAAGNLQLAFINNFFPRSIEYTTGVLTQNGISWSVPTFIPQSGTNSLWPAITTSTTGQFIQIHIVWVDASLGGYIDIFYSTAVDEQSSVDDFTYPVDLSQKNWDNAYDGHTPLSQTTKCYQLPYNQIWHAGYDIGFYAIIQPDGTWTNNTPIYAVGDGIVRYSSKQTGTDKNGKPIYGGITKYPGGVVIIEHVRADGTPLYVQYGTAIHSMYAHLNPSKIQISAGQRVTKGTLIATGLEQQVTTDKKTGAVTLDNTHLHWEMRYFYDGSEIKQAPNYKASCAGVPGPGYSYNTNDAIAHPDNFDGVIGTNKKGTLIYKTYHWTNPSVFVDNH